MTSKVGDPYHVFFLDGPLNSLLIDINQYFLVGEQPAFQSNMNYYLAFQNQASKKMKALEIPLKLLGAAHESSYLAKEALEF